MIRKISCLPDILISNEKEVDEDMVNKIKLINPEIIRRPASSPFHFELVNTESSLGTILVEPNFSEYFQKAFTSLQVTDSTKPSKQSHL